MKSRRTSLLRDPANIRVARKAGGWPNRVMTFAEINDECDVKMSFPSPNPSTPPTWSELCDLEPRLLELAREAIEIEPHSEHFCANGAWYGYAGHRGLKPRLLLLVGHEAGKHAPAALRTSAAYDVVYRTIYDALPDCRDCGCLRLSDFLPVENRRDGGSHG